MIRKRLLIIDVSIEDMLVDNEKGEKLKRAFPSPSMMHFVDFNKMVRLLKQPSPIFHGHDGRKTFKNLKEQHIRI